MAAPAETVASAVAVPEPPVASPAYDQSASPLFNRLPPEIRGLIYTFYFEQVRSPRQHVLTGFELGQQDSENRRPLFGDCILDDEQRSRPWTPIFGNLCKQADEGFHLARETFRNRMALVDNWGPHWRCLEELRIGRLGARTALDPYPLLLTSRRIYDEAHPISLQSLGFVLTTNSLLLARTKWLQEARLFREARHLDMIIDMASHDVSRGRRQVLPRLPPPIWRDVCTAMNSLQHLKSIDMWVKSDKYSASDPPPCDLDINGLADLTKNMMPSVADKLVVSMPTKEDDPKLALCRMANPRTTFVPRGRDMEDSGVDYPPDCRTSTTAWILIEGPDGPSSSLLKPPW